MSEHNDDATESKKNWPLAERFWNDWPNHLRRFLNSLQSQIKSKKTKSIKKQNKRRKGNCKKFGEGKHPATFQIFFATKRCPVWFSELNYVLTSCTYQKKWCLNLQRRLFKKRTKKSKNLIFTIKSKLRLAKACLIWFSFVWMCCTNI